MKSTRLIYISVYLSFFLKPEPAPCHRSGMQLLPWIGVVGREREVKLQRFGVTRNPYHGLAWSSARTRGTVQLFGVTRNPYHGLAWSSARTRGKIAIVSTFSASRATLTMDWCGRATEREVKLQLLGFPQGSRATLCGDWRGRACEREVKLQLFGFPQGSRATLCGDGRGKACEREVNLLLFGFPRNLNPKP